MTIASTANAVPKVVRQAQNEMGAAHRSSLGKPLGGATTMDQKLTDDLICATHQQNISSDINRLHT